ncbi:apolipoprotein B-100 [Trichonephila clavipes]|nr:apolipoprotein B-100 [Trichonephila clavipes]
MECEIASSYHNASLKSVTVLSAESDSMAINQKAYFSHIPTNTKTSNTFDFWRTYGKCTESEFKHEFHSQVLDVSTNVSYKCNSDRRDMHTLLLHSLVNSTYWDMLNLEINQIVEDTSPEYKYESCNFTHPLLVINVTADWIRKVGDHKKKVLFTCTVSVTRI